MAKARTAAGQAPAPPVVGLHEAADVATAAAAVPAGEVSLDAADVVGGVEAPPMGADVRAARRPLPPRVGGAAPRADALPVAVARVLARVARVSDATAHAAVPEVLGQATKVVPHRLARPPAVPKVAAAPVLGPVRRPVLAPALRRTRVLLPQVPEDAALVLEGHAAAARTNVAGVLGRRPEGGARRSAPRGRPFVPTPRAPFLRQLERVHPELTTRCLAM